MELQVERRTKERFRIEDSALVFCTEASGEIIDMSLKGLSFSHVAGVRWPAKSFSVNLVLENSATLIEDISCHLLSSEYDPADPDCTHWRHSIKFGTLTENQQQLLADVLGRQARQFVSIYPG